MWQPERQPLLFARLHLSEKRCYVMSVAFLRGGYVMPDLCLA